MSLHVTIDVNGHAIHRLKITNLGTPDGADRPDDGTGERLYRWRHDTTTPGISSGTVVHRREDGALELVRKVLCNMELRKSAK